MSKIIYLSNMRLPTEKAHGIQVMKMCESFAQCDANILMHTNDTNRIQVELVVPRRFNKIKKDPFDYYGVKRIFKIKKLPSLDLIPLGILKFGYFIQSWSFIKWAFWFLLFKKADFIYCRDFICLWLFKFLRRKFVFEAHYFPKHFSFYRKTLLRANAVVVITSQLKDKFIQQGMPAKKILVASDGVDLQQFQIPDSPASPRLGRGRAKFQIREGLGLPLDKKIVLYAGHLYKWKGAGVLLEAARISHIANRQSQEILFVFVGGTEKDIANCRSLIANRGLRNVLIVGHRTHREMPFWLGAADVLVLPNSAKDPISEQWTSPLKMFEYMASNQPIVASDLPSLRDVLNSKNAILVKPDSPEALAEGIRAVLESKGLADEISTQALQDVQQYTWQRRAKNILEFIE